MEGNRGIPPFSFHRPGSGRLDVTRLMLCLLFYLVITPIALVAKPIGKRFIELKWDTNQLTYWIDLASGWVDPRRIPKAIRKVQIFGHHRILKCPKASKKMVTGAHCFAFDNFRCVIILTEGSAIAAFVYTLF